MELWSLLDNVEERQRATNQEIYKGYVIERKDPYGLWHINGGIEMYTSLDMAEREIDRQIENANKNAPSVKRINR